MRLHLRVATGWQSDARDPDTGAPVEDKSKFPDGIKAVADQVHSLGLKVRCRSSANALSPHALVVWHLQQRRNVSVDFRRALS